MPGFINTSNMLKIKEATSENEKRIAANLIVQAVPEFYKIFSLNNEVLLNHLSKEISNKNNDLSNTLCLFNKKNIIAVFSSLPSNNLLNAQMYSVLRLLSLTDNNDKIKLALKAYSQTIQPLGISSYYLSRIAVEKKYRGQGLGKTLLKHFSELGKNYKVLSLHVNSKNLSAISFYKKNGFKIKKKGSWEYIAMFKKTEKVI